MQDNKKYVSDDCSDEEITRTDREIGILTAFSVGRVLSVVHLSDFFPFRSDPYPLYFSAHLQMGFGNMSL